MNFILHRLIPGALVMSAVFALCDALRAEPVAQTGEGSLEQRAHRIKLPQKYAGRKDFKMLLLGEGHQVPELEKYGREKSCFMPIAPDAGKEIFAKFASESIPRLYIIGRDGNIKLASAGSTESIFQEVVQALQKELEAPHITPKPTP